MSLKVSIHLKVDGNPNAASFADVVTEILPTREFLHDLRKASIPAILPITYKLGRAGTIVIDDA